jgi:putative transposase
VSNDNPFSEAQFKTLKYRPDLPKQFGSTEAAKAYCQRFFTWYNDVHRHGGLHVPTDVHHGHAGAVREQRAVIL